MLAPPECESYARVATGVSAVPQLVCVTYLWRRPNIGLRNLRRACSRLFLALGVIQLEIHRDLAFMRLWPD